MEVEVEKGTVSQVMAELEKLGFTHEEARFLACEKHRAHADLVKTGKKSAGQIAEEIMDAETGGAGVEASAEIAQAAAESANVGGIAPSADDE